MTWRLLTIAGLILWTFLSARALALSPWIIFFDSNSSRLTPAADAILNDTAAGIRLLEASSVTIRAAADRQGSASYNLALSRRRAEAVREALVARGVPRTSITVEALGENEPLNATADGVPDAENRYAMVLISGICRDPEGNRLPGC